MSRLNTAIEANKAIKNNSVSLLFDLYVDSEDINFGEGLSRLLKKESFLPNGGVLGFGLKYKYNYSELDAYIHGTGIAGLRASLKTIDKSLYITGTELELKPELKVIYKMDEYPGASIMTTTLSPFPNEAYPYPTTWEDTGNIEDLCNQIGGTILALPDGWTSEGATLKIEWVNPIEHVNIMPEYITKASGKRTISKIRGSYVLIMTVSAWPKREQARAGKAKKT